MQHLCKILHELVVYCIYRRSAGISSSCSGTLRMSTRHRCLTRWAPPAPQPQLKPPTSRCAALIACAPLSLHHPAWLWNDAVVEWGMPF